MAKYIKQLESTDLWKQLDQSDTVITIKFGTLDMDDTQRTLGEVVNQVFSEDGTKLISADIVIDGAHLKSGIIDPGELVSTWYSFGKTLSGQRDLKTYLVAHELGHVAQKLTPEVANAAYWANRWNEGINKDLRREIPNNLERSKYIESVPFLLRIDHFFKDYKNYTETDADRRGFNAVKQAKKNKQ